MIAARVIFLVQPSGSVRSGIAGENVEGPTLGAVRAGGTFHATPHSKASRVATIANNLQRSLTRISDIL
jgi:hypothetical protein